jgi:hypothetical protein
VIHYGPNDFIKKQVYNNIFKNIKERKEGNVTLVKDRELQKMEKEDQPAEY